MPFNKIRANNIKKIYERDNYTCFLCNKKSDKSLLKVRDVSSEDEDENRYSSFPYIHFCITVCQEQCGVVSNKELFELLNLTKPKVTPLFFDTLPDITIKI